MSCRIRHCVSCPHCGNCYLIGFSPYANGSYVVSTSVGSFEEYALYCSCKRLPMPSRWKASEMKPCEVSDTAYRRGYGSPEEIIPFSEQRVEATHICVSISTTRFPGARTLTRPLEHCSSHASSAAESSASQYTGHGRSRR